MVIVEIQLPVTHVIPSVFFRENVLLSVTRTATFSPSGSSQEVEVHVHSPRPVTHHEPVLVVSVSTPGFEPGTLVEAVATAVKTALETSAAQRIDGPDFGGAWVVVHVRGRPVGILELELPLNLEAVAERVAELPPGTGPGWDEGDGSRGRADGGEDHLPSISVVVPTVGQRLQELRRCVTSLVATQYPGLEILLVDNRAAGTEDDSLVELAAGFPDCRVVRQPVRGISAARNAGTAAALGEVVAFTDDDVHVDPGWLHAFGRRFAAHPEETVVTGLVVPSELSTSAQLRYEHHFGGFGGPRTFAPAHVAPVRGGRGRVELHGPDGEVLRRFAVYGIGAFGAGANMAFRRSALLASGGFDEALGTGTRSRGGEDLAALINVLWAGGSLGYEPVALVYHRHRPDEAGLRHQVLGSGIGFTAMLTSLVLHDRRHLTALGQLGPAAVVALAGQTVARLSRRPAGTDTGAARRTAPPVVTRDLVALELAGMPWGVVAYLRSSRERSRSTPSRRPGLGAEHVAG